MFGKFTLKQEGMEVPHAVSLTGRSRRLWTLTAYLILNRNRGVSAQELIDLLWPEAESDNPLSTLQNNVSRARAALAELGFTHAKVIIHNEKGYYRWAPDRETQLDVEQFETLAKAALAEEDMKKSVFGKLFLLPVGTVLYPGHGEPTTIGDEIKDNPINDYKD